MAKVGIMHSGSPETGQNKSRAWCRSKLVRSSEPGSSAARPATCVLCPTQPHSWFEATRIRSIPCRIQCHEGLAFRQSPTTPVEKLGR